MSQKDGYQAVPLTFNRRTVIASATVSKKKNTIHGMMEVDITVPRKLIQDHYSKTGERLSLTAYIVTCLAKVIADHPYMNSFQKGKKLILLNDITISVLIEREIEGEKVPEPIGISKAQEKSFRQIHNQIREAQKRQGDQLGSLSGSTWVRFIPGFLMRTFIRKADKNIRMAKRYGKVSVTAVGMFGKDAVWFIPHGSATVLVTVGGISEKMVQIGGQLVTREHLCLTCSFDHNIIDGAPAARFMKSFSEWIKSGRLLQTENGIK